MIFIAHIPKCGGKSFRKALEKFYGPSLELYYNNPLKKTSYPASIKYCLSKLTSYKRLSQASPSSIIYGHYCLDEFSSHHSKDGNIVGAFFRDPIEWVGSYLFYQQRKKNTNLIEHALENIQKLKLHNGFQHFLGKKSVQDLDFIGITEEYERSLCLYESITGDKLDTLYVNKTEGSPNSYLAYFEKEGILEEIRSLMQDNIKIYADAKIEFIERCKNANIA